jgi:hypothetical protein
MPMINGRYYSSLGQYSPYVSLQIQRYKSAQANQRFMENVSAGASALYDAQTSLSDGMATITARIAVARVQAAVAAKKAAMNGLVNKLT